MTSNWNKSRIVQITEENLPNNETSFMVGGTLYVIKQQNVRTTIEMRRFQYSRLLPNGNLIPLNMDRNETSFIDDYINYCKLQAKPKPTVVTPIIPNLPTQCTGIIHSNPTVLTVNVTTQTNFTRDISTSTECTAQPKIQFTTTQKNKTKLNSHYPCCAEYILHKKKNKKRNHRKKKMHLSPFLITDSDDSEVLGKNQTVE
ncbi:uncharacterized protein LOC119670592 [Teleopsis dalmanni]|uniref:uncharacterized protein LOC119670592 n=1 Tax=Teleopsis dalmanni TaxID=139649 RepID=UPI0018CFAF6D|nr:uncharacterized protein LOC119670222 isoform X2 [Teleopsis dalmanni]XP_037936327.1 uncharacterized protein LOC119670222 isoform X2 [Teleopsis dalmanni]XP_037936845.1 uncharacterized protein LOC119670592 [Teleopsis dalmanni]